MKNQQPPTKKIKLDQLSQLERQILENQTRDILDSFLQLCTECSEQDNELMRVSQGGTSLLKKAVRNTFSKEQKSIGENQMSSTTGDNDSLQLLGNLTTDDL